ncbi:MAG: hypothetical protein Ta2D_01130 [Rickettsiales bacterium]|nr:MAG: hypothetical protein Ta2D_01130 [Rickettsiales bacterium]
MKNIFYPYTILNENIFPVFGDEIVGDPHYINLVETDPLSAEDAKEWRFGEIKKFNKNWGYSGYLENRSRQLTSKIMAAEKRFFHLGIDLHVPTGIKIYAPLDGEVVVSEYEDGVGNYGGLVVLKHIVKSDVFYSVYGHLKKDLLPKLNSNIAKGENFEEIGDMTENGNWAPHLHLQVLTEKGFNEGWVHKGYCSLDNLIDISYYCPNPIFLLKYKI